MVVGDAALRAQEAVELEIGMEKEDAAAKLCDFARDSRAIGGIRLAGQPLGVPLQFTRIRLERRLWTRYGAQRLL